MPPHVKDYIDGWVRGMLARWLWSHDGPTWAEWLAGPEDRDARLAAVHGLAVRIGIDGRLTFDGAGR